MITDGSVWWTIMEPTESSGYEHGCEPSRVKAWSQQNGVWKLSAFDATGKVDDDSNCTRYQSNRDIGTTLFATEKEAWAAWLPDVVPIDRFIQSAVRDLGQSADRYERMRAAGMIGDDAWEVVNDHVERLRRQCAELTALVKP